MRAYHLPVLVMLSSMAGCGPGEPPAKPAVSGSGASPTAPGSGAATHDFSASALPPLDLKKGVESMERAGEVKTRGGPLPEIWPQVSPSVVMIESNTGNGSGALISKDGTILTNWHLVRDQESVKVGFKPADEGSKAESRPLVLGRVVRVDEIASLALVQVPVGEVPAGVVPLGLGGSGDVRLEADVHGIGHPDGDSKWGYMKGTVKEIRLQHRWSSPALKQHRAAVIEAHTKDVPVDSGAAVLSMGGKLIGVGMSKSAYDQLTMSVALDELTRFLAQQQSRRADGSLGIVGPAGSTCEVVELSRRRIKEGELVAHDRKCDGKENAWYLVPFNPKAPITYSIDTKGTGRVDIKVFDRARNFRWETSHIDIDGDGKADLIGHHADGRLRATSVRRVSDGAVLPTAAEFK